VEVFGADHYLQHLASCPWNSSRESWFSEGKF